MRKLRLALPLVLLALLLASCAKTIDNTETAASCAPADLATVTPGVLTIATGEPAYYPWVIDDKPESAEGFEAAVAYAVATELGYSNEGVKWVRTSFDSAITPGPKTFDFNMQQFSITEDRAKVVDFSSPYYKSPQVIVSFAGSKIAKATSFADLADAKLGAAVATTSLDVIENTLGLKAQVFNDNAAGVSALKNKQIDGFVVDLPTGFYLAGVEIPGGLIVGAIEGSDGADQGFGLLLSKASPLTACVSAAVDAIRASGELQKITDRWLTQAGAPVLKK